MANKANVHVSGPAPHFDPDTNPKLRTRFDVDENEPISAIRLRLQIDDEISDVTIAVSLSAIAAKGDPRARWLAAFTSPLGKWLAMRGADLNTALNVMMAHAPKSS